MTIRQSTGLRTLLAGNSGFKEAMNNGCIELRSGTQPASADDAATGTLLALVTQDGGAFTPGSPTNGLALGTPADGAVAKSGNWQYTGIAAGTIGWFRYRANAADAGGSSTSLVRMDGSCGVGSGDLQLAALALAVGQPGTIDAFLYTIPTSA